MDPSELDPFAVDPSSSSQPSSLSLMRFLLELASDAPPPPEGVDQGRGGRRGWG